MGWDGRNERRRIGAFLLGLGSLVATTVVAAPILHERFVPNPADDLRLGATTPSGSLPAALETPSGLVLAPDERRALESGEATASPYGGAKTQTSVDSSYHVDRLTTAPNEVSYDEPFRPSLLPFKRLYAFDAVAEDLTLTVRDKTLHRVPVGAKATATEDAFFGDFLVDLVANVPVRIPSVGPGARIRSLHTDPPVELEILEDGAENWFARSPLTLRVRVVVELGLPRLDLSSRLPELVWSTFDAPLLRLPERAKPSALRVIDALGLDRSERPSVVIERLVDHFRSFRASDELPRATEAGALYEELSLSQKGVCRHRAYAFVVTALGLGFRARLVHNEAHAWVELDDGRAFHRIDLGGAPARVVESRPDALVPNHRPPVDPFAWPEGSASGARLADFQGSGANSSWPSARDPGASPAASEIDPSSAVAGSIPSDTVIELTLGARETKRGAPLDVRGRATRRGEPCRVARVDLLLRTADGLRPLGSVATDRRGRFDGQITLPSDSPAGAHAIVARLGAGCGS